MFSSSQNTSTSRQLTEAMSPYQYYGTIPAGYMAQQQQHQHHQHHQHQQQQQQHHQQQQHQQQQQQQQQPYESSPEQSVALCTTPYETSQSLQYTHAMTQHQAPMQQTVLSPPMAHECSEYTFQPMQGNMTGASGRPSHSPSHEAGPGQPTNSNQERIPRSQSNLGSAVNALIPSNDVKDDANDQLPKQATKEIVEARDYLLGRVPRETIDLCMTHGEDLTFNAEASEDDLELYALRYHKTSSMYGKGMWDQITARYRKDTTTPPNTPSLQMRFLRAHRKHFMFSYPTALALLEVYIEDAQERYNRLSKKLEEDKKIFNIKSADIENFLVRLGFEELQLDMKTLMRRHKVQIPKAKSRVSKAKATPVAKNNSAKTYYSYADLQRHMRPGPSSSTDTSPGVQSSDSFSTGVEGMPNTTRTLTPADEDELVRQLEMKYGDGAYAMEYSSSQSTAGGAPQEFQHALLPAIANPSTSAVEALQLPLPTVQTMPHYAANRHHT